MNLPGTVGAGSTVLASDQRFPRGIAIHGTDVFWTQSGPAGHLIMKVSTYGRRTPGTLAVLDQGPGAIAVQGSNIYWVNQRDGAVMKVSVNGGKPQILVPGIPGGGGGIAVDGSSIYWTIHGNRFDPGSPGRVMKASLDDGSVVVLASAQNGPHAIAVDAASVYWTNFGTTSNGGQDDDGEDELGGEFLNGTVMRVPIKGGTPVCLAAGQKRPGAIAIDGTNVVWVNEGTIAGGFRDGTVMRVSISGGAATTLVSGQPCPRSVALAGAFVFWPNASNGTVMKIPIEGGCATILAASESPTEVVVYGGLACWLDQGGSGAEWSECGLDPPPMGTVMHAPVTSDGPAILAVESHGFWRQHRSRRD